MRLPSFLSNLNLAPKLNLLLLLVLGITFVGVGWLTTGTLRQIIITGGQQRAGLELEVFANQLSHAEEDLLADARVMVRTNGLGEQLADLNFTAVRTALLPQIASLELTTAELVHADGSSELIFDSGGLNVALGEEENLTALLASGIETTTIVDGNGTLLLVATAPIKDQNGALTGGLLISQAIDAAYLEELSFQREDIHFAVMQDNRFVVQDSSGAEKDEFDFAIDPELITQALGGESVTPSDLENSGVDADFYALGPMEIGNQVVGVLVAKVEAEELLTVEQIFTSAILFGFGVAALLALLAAIFFMRRVVTRPIEQLKATTQIVASGNYHERATIRSNDEIGQLGQDFNKMANAVEQQITEVQTARDQAQRSDRVKSAFLANMSHELRTPLNSVINFTKFVSAGDLGPVNQQQEEMLNEVVKSGRHLLSLINDVLDMSKIEAGALTLFVEENVNLRAALEQAISTSRALVADKPVALEIQIDPDLPPIRGDRQRLLQVFLNVLSNACKFTERGAIQIQAQQTAKEVLISVRDSGPGIAPEDQPLVFEPFRQTSRGLRQGSGTGLGMPISKNLIEAHGGTFRLESEVGKGTTFYLSIPIRSEILTPLRLTPEFAL